MATEHWFDDLTRLAATGVSRREALGWLGRRLGGLAVLMVLPDGWAQGQRCDGRTLCTPPNFCCGDVCCDGSCCCPGICAPRFVYPGDCDWPPIAEACQGAQPAEDDVFSTQTEEPEGEMSGEEEPSEGEMSGEEEPSEDAFDAEAEEPGAEMPPDGASEAEVPPAPGDIPEADFFEGADGPEEVCYDGEALGGGGYSRQHFRSQPPCPCVLPDRRCPTAERPFGACCPPSRECCDYGVCCHEGWECRPVGRGGRRVCVQKCTGNEDRCPTRRGAFGQCCPPERDCCEGGVCCNEYATCANLGGGSQCVFDPTRVPSHEPPPPWAETPLPPCGDGERRCFIIGDPSGAQCCPWGRDCCAHGRCCSPGHSCVAGSFCVEVE